MIDICHGDPRPSCVQSQKSGRGCSSLGCTSDLTSRTWCVDIPAAGAMAGRTCNVATLVQEPENSNKASAADGPNVSPDGIVSPTVTEYESSQYLGTSKRMGWAKIEVTMQKLMCFVTSRLGNKLSGASGSAPYRAVIDSKSRGLPL